MLKLLSRFFPRETNFFELFSDSAEIIVQSAGEFQSLVKELPVVESRARAIKALENRADEITHRTVELLHRTFITPLDREDIHQLAGRLDDIVDFLDAATQRILMYGISDLPQEATGLAEVICKSAEQVRAAVEGLKDLEQSDTIMKACVEINRLENEGDQLLRAGLAKLFRDEPDTRKLIKTKEILELLETVTDRCEDVANVIEGIVLEYA